MRNIDYARLRYCSLINLLKNEITSTSFCLTKDGFLRNPSRMNVYLKCQSVTNASGRFQGLRQENASKKNKLKT